MSDSLRTNGSSGGFGRDERELELLAAYALGAIEPGEESEVARLLDADGRRLVESLELAAAAATVAGLARDAEPMPHAVRETLAASASRWTATPDGASPSLRLDAGPRKATPPAETSPLRVMAWTGWIAAAASLTLAGIAWMPMSRQASTPSIGDYAERAMPGMSSAALVRVRDNLIARQGDVILTSWGPLDEPDPTAASAGGDVIWSTDEQTGVMRISGLASNDPQEFQYQLWIFDEGQKHPIDGGVFDIPATGGGEVVVAIDPKIAVSKPTMFAVTVEKPGGVVVSDRSRIALLGAKPKPVADCSPAELGRARQ
jgi:anti-sigma-K factor RskA